MAKCKKLVSHPNKNSTENKYYSGQISAETYIKKIIEGNDFDRERRKIETNANKITSKLTTKGILT